MHSDRPLPLPLLPPPLLPNPVTPPPSPSPSRRKSTSKTPDFSPWNKHDELLATNWKVARKLQSNIDRLRHEFEQDQQHATTSPQELAALQKKQAELEAATTLCQKTWDIYYWAQDKGREDRAESPWDTAAARQSRYAAAIGLEGEKWISPMRGVLVLNNKLEEAWHGVAKLDALEWEDAAEMEAAAGEVVTT
ncbi:hypothetical protein GMOD_00009209 [Pyrenophora seminiperda CCB06]|uniref:Uncharacterized protein n=1 Tax=Pyrenophora seminiperda CCB06 TaxID=1302712 RepID=A0A3M7MBN1_9PLEO|nr:hypothetical protein GMOD_00009209 [Pyrenophora seminiperda CCB06]